MTKLHLVRAKLIHPLVAVLNEVGAPVNQVLAQAHIPEQALVYEELLVSGIGLRELMVIVERDYRIKNLGFRLIEVGGLTHLGAIIDKVKTDALTLLDGLHILCDAINLIANDAKNWVEKTSAGAWFCHQSTDNIPLGKHVMEQYVIAVMVEFVRMFTQDNWRPQSVWYERLDAQPDIAEVVQGGQVYRGQSCSKIFIEQKQLLLLNPFKQVVAEEQWQEIEVGDFVATVKTLLLPHFRQLVPSIDDAVLITGFSKRSLQRYLALNKITYRQLIQQIRYDLAIEALTNSNETVNQISHNLGYLNDSHFMRAFKRWSGLTPSQYRKQHTVTTDK